MNNIVPVSVVAWFWLLVLPCINKCLSNNVCATFKNIIIRALILTLFAVPFLFRSDSKYVLRICFVCDFVFGCFSCDCYFFGSNGAHTHISAFENSYGMRLKKITRNWQCIFALRTEIFRLQIKKKRLRCALLCLNRTQFYRFAWPNSANYDFRFDNTREEACKKYTLTEHCEEI